MIKALREVLDGSRLIKTTWRVAHLDSQGNVIQSQITNERIDDTVKTAKKAKQSAWKKSSVLNFSDDCVVFFQKLRDVEHEGKKYSYVWLTEYKSMSKL